MAKWPKAIGKGDGWSADGMSFEAGAAAPLNYLTALCALARRAHAQPGTPCWCMRRLVARWAAARAGRAAGQGVGARLPGRAARDG